MTSMPASRSARAMIFAPRSWPSRPGLATTTRIFLVDVLLTAARKLMRTRMVSPRHGGAGLIAGGIVASGNRRNVAASGDRAPGRRHAAAPPSGCRPPDRAHALRARRRPRAADRRVVGHRPGPAGADAPRLRRDRPLRL